MAFLVGSEKIERTIIAFIAVCALLSAVFAEVMYDDRVAIRSAGEILPSYLWPVVVLEKASFGFRNLSADVLWIGAIQFYQDWDRKNPAFIQYFDSITTLDPKFEYPYLFASLILPEGDPGMEQTRRIVEKGLIALPDNWQLPFYLGMQYHSVQHDFSNAMRYINRAADMPNAPAIVKETRAYYAVKSGDYSTGRVLLETLYKTADNEHTKEIAKQKLELLVLLEALGRGVAVYKQRFGVFPSSVEQLFRKGIISRLPEEVKGLGLQVDQETGRIYISH